jgi:hypothetical protein
MFGNLHRMRAYIVSLNFNPGHVSHLMASYRQCQELGYDAWLYIDKEFTGFVPQGSQYIVYGESKPVHCGIAIFVFPSQRNLKEILWLKSKGCRRVVYIFHEPLDKYSIYRNAGFSRMKMLKLRVINAVNALTVKWSDVILLPSQKAVTYYEANHLYKNVNYHYMPLLYDDEWNDTYKGVERRYFSYIGHVASDHSFQEFVDFVTQAIQSGDLKDVRFLIATRSKVEQDGNMARLLNSGRFELVEGKPLTDEQINHYYASSIAVWNAYTRTTQSGVLAKAFMFGTPAIVLKKNLSEFVEDGQEVVAINSNTEYDSIRHAIEMILNNFSSYSAACRKRFLHTFFYRNFCSQMKSILSIA